MIDVITLIVAFGSLCLSAYNFFTVKSLQSKTLVSTAADRALQRFNKVNELFLVKPELNRVLRGSYADLKRDDEAETFIWYLFNQLEGTYLDFKLDVLKQEYFNSYEQWLKFQLGRNKALTEFLRQPDADKKVKPYFSLSYWDYLQNLTSEALAKKTVGQPGKQT